MMSGNRRLTLSMNSSTTQPAPTEAERFVPLPLIHKPAATEARIRVEVRRGARVVSVEFGSLAAPRPRASSARVEYGRSITVTVRL